VGRNYGDVAEVDTYDETHARFRDLAREHASVLEWLALEPQETLVDIGAGTGAFAVFAAARCRHVHVVDVSRPMLDAARRRATRLGVGNLSFHHAGFLTLDLPPGSVDAVTSTFALHHLPDFWKGVALGRTAACLGPGGRFHLCDVVLPAEEPLSAIRRFVEAQASRGGEELREDAAGHFRSEHSTSEWVMRGLLERAGLRVVREGTEDGVIRRYLCGKAG